jgi:Rod binding domain-containing protein
MKLMNNSMTTPITTHKLSKKKEKKAQIPKHPLAKLAGRFEGEFWENTLLEIQNMREAEKQEINQALDNN